MKKTLVLIFIVALAGLLLFTLINKKNIFQSNKKETIEITPEKMEFENEEKTENEKIISIEEKTEKKVEEKKVEEKIKEEKMYPASLKINMNKKVIESDNIEKVNFTVEVYDQKGNKIAISDKDEVEIYVNNQKISNNVFSTSEKGEYSVYAKYKNLYSPQAGIIAQKTKLFKDKAFEEEVRKTIGKKTGKITSEDLKELPVLIVENKKIKSIEGIEYMTSLKELKLTGNEIEDISYLSKLENLEKLWLDENKISNIEPLSDLKKIHYLELGSNKISDIKSISSMTKIKKLYIYNNKITDIRPIVNLNELVELAVWDNPLEKSSENIFTYLEKKSCKVYK